MSIYGINNLMLVAMVTALPLRQNFHKSCFDQYIHQQNFRFKTSMIPELFRIILSKCHHSTLEPRFQATN